MNSSRFRFALLVALLPLPAFAAPPHRVPPGFVLESVAPDVVFPMFAAFDDRGRLFVAESSGLDLYKEISALTRKCRIRLLEDPDANGRFRKSTIWADNLVFPMGLAWRDGKLYVADPPDLITLEDTDGDGKADRRTVILGSFGHKDNGSLHGLTFGPDGWLYMTMGSPDGYKLRRKDGTVLSGTSGALIRCRPDGSDPEVMCRGFVNLVEIAFTPRGEIIGTDNWFQKPVGGIRDALVHLVDGGLYPYEPDTGTRFPVTGEPLGPLALFPAVALSGLMRYEGTAFPTEMHGNLFAAQHNSRKISRHVLVPEGATFRAQDFDFVTTDDADFHPSDVLEAADGSIYVVDTGSWYVHHCPTGQIRKTEAKGGIYRIRPEKWTPAEDPWGLKIEWELAPVAQLVNLLEDRRPVVRDKAREALAARGKPAVPPLADLLTGSSNPAHKQQAVWALAMIADESALRPLRQALGSIPEVATPAARALGLCRDRPAAKELAVLLASPQPVVRLAAVEALARCGSEESLPALWQQLRNPVDRFEEHALIHAIHHLAAPAALEKALNDPHPRVQRAALLLLDQPPRPIGSLKADVVMARMAASDAELRQTALRILQKHPEWADQAISLLRQWLQKPALNNEEQTGLRSMVLAFQGLKTVQQLIADSLVETKTPADRRTAILETIAQTGQAQVPKVWRDALGETIAQSEPAVRLQAVRTVAVLQVPQYDDALAALAEKNDEALELRIEALRAIVHRRPKLSAGVFAMLLGQLDDKMEPLTRLAAAEVLGRSKLEDGQLKQLLAKVRGEALIAPAVLLPAVQRSVTESTAPALLDYLTESLRTGWRPSEAELSKVLDSLPRSAKPGSGKVREVWKQGMEKQRARLAEFEPLLSGGNVARGREVFFGKKVACATCHRIGADGGPIGPDLTKLGTIRAGGDILESIVLPSPYFSPD
jgi:putative membrane-bound dehydrogenase-like protein